MNSRKPGTLQLLFDLIHVVAEKVSSLLHIFTFIFQCTLTEVILEFISLLSSILHSFVCPKIVLEQTLFCRNSLKRWRICTSHSIGVDFNRAVVWIVLILPMLFYYSVLFWKPFSNIPSVPVITDTIAILIVHSFVSTLERLQWHTFFSFST